jgi:hypothetical protein
MGDRNDHDVHAIVALGSNSENDGTRTILAPFLTTGAVFAKP